MDLFKHNKEIINKYKKLRETHKNILIIQGTGLGKTNVAIEIIDLYYKNKPILYVVPKDVLKSNVKRNEYWNYPNVQFICYQSLKKYNPRNYSLCVFDEAHRACAPKWTIEARRFIDCESCNILGLTATEVRMDGVNVAKHLFNEDDTIYGIDIFKAIELGILPRPNYISADLEPEKTIDEIEHMTANCTDIRRRLIIDKLKYIKENDFNEMKIENIIPKYNNGSNKFMIFVSSIEECEKWCSRFKSILNTKKVFQIHTRNSAEHNREMIEYFNAYDGSDNIAIIGIDILLEGLHIEGLSQVIMLRNTKSYPVYIQMLGRALSCVEKDITPVIFDFMQNYKTKQPDEEYISYIINNRVGNVDTNERSVRYNKIKRYFNIIKDYVVDFEEIFDIIKTQKVIWTDEIIEDLKNLELSNTYIAKKYNISISTVSFKRKKINIKSNFGKDQIIWTDEMLKDIMNPDLSNAAISKKYIISATVVSNKRSSLNIKTNFNKTNIWTDEMLKDIMNPDLSNSYISKKYGISAAVVSNKRSSLNIKTNFNKTNIWTDEMLKDIMNPEIKNIHIMNKYGLGEGVVYRKRKILGVKSNYSKTKIIWTDEMLKDIMNPDIKQSYLIDKYGLSGSTISAKRKSLNIHPNSKIIWTDEMLKDIMNPDVSNKNIIKKYNICSLTVSKKRRDIGVKSNYSKTRIIWTDEMLKDIMNPDLSNSYISKKYNISLDSVRDKRKLLNIKSKYSKQK